VRLKKEFYEGRFPADRLFDGAIILVGATLLITPGLFTDFFGILCLFPSTRTIFRNFIKHYLEKKINSI